MFLFSLSHTHTLRLRKNWVEQLWDQNGWIVASRIQCTACVDEITSTCQLVLLF